MNKLVLFAVVFSLLLVFDTDAWWGRRGVVVDDGTKYTEELGKSFRLGIFRLRTENKIT